MIACNTESPVKVLILSGNNNHDWKSTTPFIKKVLDQNGFVTYVTEKPDTLNQAMLKHFDAIVSNWNSFPEQNEIWNPDAKQALSDFISGGGGFVCIHGASATHYDWEPFFQFTGGRWGNKTHHGEIADHKVEISNKTHPVTKGMDDFEIRDELWIDLECNASAEALCVVSNGTNSPKMEPVVLATHFGKGKGYYLVLGHDTTVMKNPNWQDLLIRGTQWVANRNINKIKK